MKKNWIDFKALRKQLDFAQVLKHYGVEVKAKGTQHHGFCPLPNHNGKGNSPSFSANLEKGIFQCFGCGAKGNVLEFAALMEKADPQDGSALLAIASKLQKQFCPEIRSGEYAENESEAHRQCKLAIHRSYKNQCSKPPARQGCRAFQSNDPPQERRRIHRIHRPKCFRG